MRPIRRLAPLAAVLAVAVAAAALAAQQPDAGTPRFGVWKLRSDAPAPFSNVMTYEPWSDGGMSITVASTNAEGRSSEWGYNTMFDGVFRTVSGLAGSDTAVEVVDERSTRILNRRDGHVYQVIINTLSEDGNRIDNDYVRFDDEGRVVRVTRAIYDRIED